MTDTAPHAAEGGKQRNHDHKGHDKDKDKAKDKDGAKQVGKALRKAEHHISRTSTRARIMISNAVWNVPTRRPGCSVQCGMSRPLSFCNSIRETS